MPPRLQHLSPLEAATIASFLRKKDLLQAAVTSSWCLKAFSPQIKRISLCPSLSSPHPHYTTICQDKEGQAAILASLLSRLSGLRELSIACADVLVWALATALLSSSPCPHLTTLDFHDIGHLPSPRTRICCPTATLLASVITSGCLNGLQDLGFCDLYSFEEDGAGAIVLASLASPTVCPNLSSLTFSMGDIKEDGVKALAQALTARAAAAASPMMSQRILLKSLNVRVSNDLVSAGFDDILRSGVCDELEELTLSQDYSLTPPRVGLDVVAAYLLANDGCRKLRELNIELTYTASGSELRGITRAFCCGGAPSLQSLSIMHTTDRGMTHLATAFKAGAVFSFGTFSDGALMNAFMAGVLSSGHSGASLHELNFEYTLILPVNAHALPLQVNEDISLALVKGLKDGAYLTFKFFV